MISLSPAPTVPIMKGRSDPLSSLSRSYRRENAELWNLLRLSQRRLAEIKSNEEKEEEDNSDFEFGWSDDEDDDDDNDDDEEKKCEDQQRRNYEQEHREVRDLLLQSKRRLSIIFHDKFEKDTSLEIEEDTDSVTLSVGSDYESEFDIKYYDDEEESYRSSSPLLLGNLWNSTRNLMSTFDESLDEKTDNVDSHEVVDKIREFKHSSKNVNIITEDINSCTISEQQPDKKDTQQEVTSEFFSPEETFLEEVGEISGAISSFWNVTRSSTKNMFKAAIETVKDEFNEITEEFNETSVDEDLNNSEITSHDDESIMDSSSITTPSAAEANDEMENDNLWNTTQSILAGISPIKNANCTAVESERKISPGGLWSSTKNILVAAVENVTEELDSFGDEDAPGKEEVNFISSTKESVINIIAPRVHDKSEESEFVTKLSDTNKNKITELNSSSAKKGSLLWNATKNIFSAAVESVAEEIEFIDKELFKEGEKNDIVSFSMENSIEKKVSYEELSNSMQLSRSLNESTSSDSVSNLSDNARNSPRGKSLKPTVESVDESVSLHSETDWEEEVEATGPMKSLWGGFSTWSRLQKLGDDAVDFLELTQ